MMADIRGDGPERQGYWQAIVACAGTAADRRNQYRFILRLLAWAITFVGASWLLGNRGDLAPVLAWSLALVPNLFAIAALFAYLRFLREADELVRRIQLEGLAFGFGAGVVAAMAWFTLERVGIPQLSGDTVVLIMLMGWVTGQLAASWRYR